MQDSQLTPTADVEKIAREKAVDFCEKQGLREAFIGEDLRRAMLTVAAQARAPLAEAAKQAIPRLERCTCAGSDGHRLNLKIAERLAALTGTGEKEDDLT